MRGISISVAKPRNRHTPRTYSKSIHNGGPHNYRPCPALEKSQVFKKKNMKRHGLRDVTAIGHLVECAVSEGVFFITRNQRDPINNASSEFVRRQYIVSCFFL